MKLLYRIDEVAEQFSISVRSVYNLIYEGKLEAINDHRGKKGLRVTGKSMEKFIEENKIDPTELNTATREITFPTRKIISKGIE